MTALCSLTRMLETTSKPDRLLAPSLQSLSFSGPSAEVTNTSWFSPMAKLQHTPFLRALDLDLAMGGVGHSPKEARRIGVDDTCGLIGLSPNSTRAGSLC